MNRMILSSVAAVVLMVLGTSLAAQELPKKVFVPDFTGDISGGMGAVLASAVSVTLTQRGIEALTLKNLNDQLRQEEYKEVLKCEDSKCVDELISGFGVATRLFGVVTEIEKEEWYIELSLARKGRIKNKVSDSVSCASKELGKAASRLALQLLGLTAENDDSFAGDGSVTHGVHLDEGESIVNEMTDDTGFLVLETEPSGAVLKVNGKEVGRSPKQLEQMVGRYVVVAEMGKLWHRARQEVNLTTEGARVGLKLEPAFGTLKVNATPSDAEIWIDGEKEGKGRYESTKKPSGKYSIRVERENYLSFSEEVVVEDGKRVEREVKLEENFGSLKVTSTPSGGGIVLNGKATEWVTPHEFPVLEPGVYSVTVKQEGYGDGVSRATVEKGKRATVDLSLEARLGMLSVMSSYKDGEPCQGKLYVDGEL